MKTNEELNKNTAEAANQAVTELTEEEMTRVSGGRDLCSGTTAKTCLFCGMAFPLHRANCPTVKSQHYA